MVTLPLMTGAILILALSSAYASARYPEKRGPLRLLAGTLAVLGIVTLEAGLLFG